MALNVRFQLYSAKADASECPRAPAGVVNPGHAPVKIAFPRTW
jgi:hypothetical protein